MPELFEVANLKERYKIGKQAEINRRKHLNIKPTKVQGTYYITDQQLELLDALDRWLTEKGGKMADFHPSLAVDSLDSSGGHDGLDRSEDKELVYQEATIVDHTEEIEPQPNWEDLIGMLADKLQPARSPLQNWRELEEACEKGWLLTTRQVHELVGSKPYGSTWERGAFIFTKAGKIGRETAWEIEKKV
jgi:hypothetical protein